MNLSDKAWNRYAQLIHIAQCYEKHAMSDFTPSTWKPHFAGYAALTRRLASIAINNAVVYLQS